MRRPAATDTDSGENAESPAAIVSAFTNSPTCSAFRNIAGAVVDFPAPIRSGNDVNSPVPRFTS
jgi:hypothetical protein